MDAQPCLRHSDPEQAMIFHHPLPLEEDGAVASRIRPWQMARAFEQLGYQVERVTGYSADRQRAIARLKKEIAQGRRFAFLYSESSTMPTALTDPHRWSIHPWLDLAFWAWLRRRGIPIGLFYRDFYWRFPLYRERVPWYKRAITIPLYGYEWWAYGRLVNHLFLPTMAAREVLPTPWPQERLSALWPGCNPVRLAEERPQDGILRLFYVGSVVPQVYDVKKLMEIVRTLEGISLTICCPEKEWQVWSGFYAPALAENIHIVHAHGATLEPYFRSADTLVILQGASTYFQFAMPFKLFDALGYGLPAITSAGTEAARFVAQENIGWKVANTEELRNLLLYLRAHPEALAAKRRAALAARERHTWLVRARTVAEILTGRQPAGADAPR